MRYTLHENLSNRKGVISNTHGFLNRFLDTGYKTKWTGYWSPPHKFLDYHAVRVNGLWLDRESLKGVEYGESMVFHHETESLEIKEEIEVPEEFPGFKIEIKVTNSTGQKKAVKCALEPAIDIRHKQEDIGSDSYELGFKDRGIFVKNGRSILIEPQEEYKFSEARYLKEHFPGEKQKAFIPGEIAFEAEIEPGSSENFRIDFTTSDPGFKVFKSPEQNFEHGLSRLFNSSIQSLENLIYDRNGVGLAAGHPWFQNYWARDSFISVLGLIDAGYFELSEQILENFAERGLPGKINLDGSGTKVSRADTCPLFVIATDKLRRHYRISETLKSAQKATMDELKLDRNLVRHDPCGTWMDTVRREKAIEIQSLWLKAAEIMGDKRKKRLEKGLEKFRAEGEIRDQVDRDSGTVNTVFPLIFDQFEDKITLNQLERINAEFVSQYGVRTKSMVAPDYDPEGYHSGSTWGLTTCLGAIANFRHGNHKKGVNILQKMEKLLDNDQPGALPEVVNSETGHSMGCSEQAWSAGLCLHAIDTYLLGIKVRDEYVEIDPAPGLTAGRKGKRIRGEKIDLKFKDGDVELLNDPEIDIRL